jgi:hypothetical protein
VVTSARFVKKEQKVMIFSALSRRERVAEGRVRGAMQRLGVVV